MNRPQTSCKAGELKFGLPMVRTCSSSASPGPLVLACSWRLATASRHRRQFNSCCRLASRRRSQFNSFCCLASRRRSRTNSSFHLLSSAESSTSSSTSHQSATTSSPSSTEGAALTAEWSDRADAREDTISRRDFPSLGKSSSSSGRWANMATKSLHRTQRNAESWYRRQGHCRMSCWAWEKSASSRASRSWPNVSQCSWSMLSKTRKTGQVARCAMLFGSKRMWC
jgi:hypothetical protein